MSVVLKTIKVTKLNNWWQKSIGLIGKKKAEPVLIYTRFGIHTFGLRFSIDVVVLDNQNRVVAIKEHLKPNRFFFWNPFYNRVLELPAGTIKKRKIKIGDWIKVF